MISGLTGHRVGGWECTKFGLATHYVRYRVETSHWSIMIPPVIYPFSTCSEM